jgi:hypothetical protein
LSPRADFADRRAAPRSPCIYLQSRAGDAVVSHRERDDEEQRWSIAAILEEHDVAAVITRILEILHQILARATLGCSAANTVEQQTTSPRAPPEDNLAGCAGNG